MIHIKRRDILKIATTLPVAAILSRSHAAETSNPGVREIDISAFDKVLLPREHGQLAQFNQPLMRRYPSRDHCMQMAAFFNDTEGMLVIANDPKAGICDWQIFPKNKLRLTFYGDVPQPLIIKIDPTIQAAATEYSKWAHQQSWFTNRTRTTQQLNFISVASSSTVKAEQTHLNDIINSLTNPIGVWFTQWRQYPFDRMYPDYTPKEKANFPQLLADLDQKQIVSLPYINGLLWDINLTNFNQKGKDLALRTKTLSLLPYNNELNFLTYACPYAAEWQSQLVNVRRNVKDAHGKPCNGVYLDMLAAAEPSICMAANHGHAPGDPYSWTAGMRSLLSQIEGSIMVEGCAEVLLDKVDYMLMHLYTNQPDMAPLWNLVYGGQTQSVGWQLPPQINRESFSTLLKKSAEFGVSAMATPWMTSEPESVVYKRLMNTQPSSPPNVSVRLGK